MTAYIVMDTQMPERLIEFYTELQGVEVLLAYDDGRYHALAPNREGLIIVLQRVPEPKTGKNRMHLDVHVADIAAEVDRLLSLGATRVTPEPVEEHGMHWFLMADPEGNEFCVCDGGAC